MIQHSVSVRSLVQCGLVCLVGVLSTALPVRGDVRIMRLNSATSRLQLEGSFAGIPLVDQGEGGLMTSFGGQLVVESSDGRLQLIAGSSIRALESGPWEPGSGQSPGPLSAAFAAKGTSGSGFNLASATIALRQLSFSLISQPIAFENGTASSAGEIQLRTPDLRSPRVDYVWHQLVSRAGHLTLALAVTNSPVAIPTLQAAFEVQRLTLPIDIVVGADFDSPGDVVFHLTGSIEGTFGLSLQSSELRWVLGGANDPAFTLVWNSGYGQLQRATRLDLPNWEAFPADPPLRIPFSSESEFFRVVFH